jgi:alkylation response protein AidB-like acyl-CoA dehydrogenase
MAQTRTDTNADPAALAAELRPLLARNAARAERDRRLPTENVDALQAANLFKVMVPRRWGGYGAPLSTTLRTFAELAKGCSSSGWVTMIIGGVTYYASLLPDRGQEEIFADPANFRICGGAGSPTSIGKRWTAAYASRESFHLLQAAGTPRGACSRFRSRMIPTRSSTK